MSAVSFDELNLLNSKLCRTLSEPKRIQILYALQNKPHHVTALSSTLNTPQSTISRHLAILRQCGLVTSERQGASTIYRLQEPQIIDIIDSIQELLKRTFTRQSNMLV